MNVTYTGGATSGKMKSLRLFMEKKGLQRGVRTSLENFGRLEIPGDPSPRTIDIIPVYALGGLTAPAY